MKQNVVRWIKRTILLGTACLALLLGMNAIVYFGGKAHIVTPGEAGEAQAIIVLGAYVHPDGRPSDMVRWRLDAARQLYEAKKAPKILITGDHGREEYDEVNAMRRYLEAEGVPTEDIFMDHAGFDTYNSMYRARDIFQVKTAIVVTQQFHLPRAVYLARRLGLDAQGVESDQYRYPGQNYYELREMGARIKAFGEALFKPKPVFLGPVIPITGDGRETHDQPK